MSKITMDALALDALACLASRRSATGLSAPRSASEAALQERFEGLILSGDVDAAFSLVRGLLAEGQSYHAIVDTLFADAARRLGAAWEQDAFSFVAMGRGVATLLQTNAALRDVQQVVKPGSGAQALFASLPDQKHTLGIICAAQAFRRQGCRVDLLLGAAGEDIVLDLRLGRVALLGLTAGREDRLGAIATLAARVKESANPPAIILGGAAAAKVADGDCAGLVDCVAHDLETALAFAQRVGVRLSQ
ncbi:hypothetical protein [Cognatishimia sp. F0-27]|uniref:hypothetical protein n=1 Tax=Cognatishimia sp. F0-27 TaxID=2816855 RepID=UPI001D0C2624|nr:hypothetical protein [Cognatishimia sp. F0-27]MCC1492969.1 hypothetical protein [Cognatishimia sp. F0-27]